MAKFGFPWQFSRICDDDMQWVENAQDLERVLKVWDNDCYLLNENDQVVVPAFAGYILALMNDKEEFLMNSGLDKCFVLAYSKDPFVCLDKIMEDYDIGDNFITEDDRIYAIAECLALILLGY